MYFDDDAVINLFNVLYAQAIDEYIRADMKMHDPETHEDLIALYERQFRDSQRFLFKDNPMSYDTKFLQRVIAERSKQIHEKKKNRQTERQSDNKAVQRENSGKAE